MKKGEIVSLKSGNTYSVEKMLEVVDSLRTSIEKGEVTSFGAVGVTPDSETVYWLASARPTPRLLIEGALHRLLTFYS